MTNSDADPIDARWKRRLPLVPGIVAFPLYLATMCRTISYGGDCGDLISSSYTLGISHPTGYPLYMILGKAFAWIPVGEVALRYNMLSSVSGALATILVASITTRATGNSIAGITSGIGLTTFYVFWSQAVIAEVYTMSAALSALLILILLVASESDDIRWTFTFFLVSGLAFAHHLSTLFVFLPAVLFMICIRRHRSAMSAIDRRIALRLVAVAVLLFVAPLLVYAYLPIRSVHPEFHFWGDLTKFPAFWAHATGGLYKPHMFALSAGQILERLSTLGVIIGISYTAGVLLLLIGIVDGLRKRPAFSLMLLAIAVFNAAIDLPYDVGDWLFFFFPLYVVLAILVGFGAACLLTAAKGFGLPAARLLVTALVVLSPCISAPDVYKRVDFSKNHLARDDATTVLSRTEPESRIFMKSDELLFSLWYIQRVHGMFRDRLTISNSKFGKPDEITPDLIRAITDSVYSKPTYVTFWVDRGTLPGSYSLRPSGKACQVVKVSALKVDVPHAIDTKLTLRTVPIAKRGLLLPIDAEWTGSESLFEVRMAFVRAGSRIDPPPDSTLNSTMTGEGMRGLPQRIGWEASRVLGQWARRTTSNQELLAVEIPDNVLPARYRLYIRETDNSKWKLATTLQVTDF